MTDPAGTFAAVTDPSLPSIERLLMFCDLSMGVAVLVDPVCDDGYDRRLDGGRGVLAVDICEADGPMTVHGLPPSASLVPQADQEVVGELVGELTWTSSWATADAELDTVAVHPRWRRRGLATTLWRHVHSRLDDRGITLAHSEVRTPDGHRWARSVSPDCPDPIETLHPLLFDAPWR